ncbi:amino acid adenylation domain-containing protein [Streptomyces sp. G-G2]|uniref:amino acid adenylation domain-containing protein n=1 Tax=Streptomyces sp. G-G2 TaxID=3046201 RepID=UPI0024B8DC6F|nr:amino acid adenylation domain-containing protein [Streptomyces sp. G-G2]MDJ0380044.1 amino acid adenylation domain-containing protein [Streptomyces sp. G-G2]
MNTDPTGESAARAAALSELLAEQVRARPEEVAAICGDLGLTYRELGSAADRLGRRLRRLGAGVDTPVGLYAEPSLDLMTGVWGILASGGAYLPLSPDYPEDRLRYMIEDSALGVIVTQRHLASKVRELAPAGVTVVTLGDDIPASPQDHPAAGPADLAYVIYTSGSTGRPKGVLIEQHSIVSQLGWLVDQGHLGPGTTVLQKTPMSFDAAQWEILAPAAGGRVVMGAPGCYRDPEDLIDTIVRHGVTTLQCVPTLLQALLDTERLASCTSLHRVFSGGEALTVKLARAFAAQLPGACLVNLYGPTECTINATAHTVDLAALAGEEASAIVSIGVPVADTGCFILDEELRPVGPGTKGELYIGGVQLARGYLNLPEQTKERFVDSNTLPGERLYRTGDLASWNEDGTIRFRGRADTQVKLRGYRVELEEITSAIEEHTWVRRAAALVADDPRTGFQQLFALVELNPREAALMDQGAHGAHHQSKASKLQVKAQLSNPGLRPAKELADRPVSVLPGQQASGHQRREVFARKTYRFYEGGKVTRADLRELLGPRAARSRRPASARDLTYAQLGSLLRWFGPFGSGERLLPKYAYASPGALYAVQMYLETGSGVAGLAAGIHYFHPVDHTLVRIGDSPPAASGPLSPGALRVHFLGRRQAIEPVYSTNIEEVLEFETGHMLGVFEEVLPEYGLTLRPAPHGGAAVKAALDVADEDHFVGTFEVVPDDRPADPDPVELFVQAHPGRVLDLPGGLYRLDGEDFTLVAAEAVEKRHVIAINQGVYEAASFGVSAVSRVGDERLAYLSLGRTLHRLQRNALRIGLMSSGYSSRSGHPLPTAERIDAVLAEAGIPSGPSYFFLGGKVSEEQVACTGMREDSVHMRGPTEMIRDDLARLLPDYMIPNQVLVLDALPLTANGKIDYSALAAREELTAPARGSGVHVPPGTRTERLLAGAWGKALKYRDVANVSMTDSFFASGGNSLIAMTLTRWINREFGIALPMQTLFGHPRLADLADRIADADPEPASRLVLLHDSGPAEGPYTRGPVPPVYCWPGLGGYPMNLRLLAREAATGGPFYGVQAAGINAGETPFATIGEMAAADVAEIRRLQPDGPYTLWGYSFGARVAFESAWQLEQAGQRVSDLLLICPGNPRVRDARGLPYDRESSYRNPGYVTILYSVFAGSVAAGPDLAACLAAARDEDSLVGFVTGRFPELDPDTVRRITRIVRETYEFDYTFHEMTERCLRAPVTIVRAAGDDYSFIEGRSGYSATPPVVIDLAADHYQALRPEGIEALVAAVRTRTPSDA